LKIVKENRISTE